MLLCFGCGQSKDDGKGLVGRANERMSKSAVEYVHKPMSKARQVEGMAQQHREAAAATGRDAEQSE